MKVAGEIDAVGAATKDKAWQSQLLFILVAFRTDRKDYF